ncbi:TonB-dependent siderophore receptor [Pseudomonas sp. ABC1]|uniref:TonB-dependent siderophore receptor n=1 Tax=Pseudomonas sp. ABC1 TaxID=2748080 RepID=UPI0015C3ABA3|nr:TonB-dependent siderophore receptor [Pseudomonas sp. ABC1]QLF93436.1 TonB-dependent siderophore receptor [Pseudomonas sp. ABC1]
MLLPPRALLPLAVTLSMLAPLAAQADDLELSEIHVRDAGDSGYKAGKASVASKVALTPREIPESISVLTRQQMDDQNMVGMEQALQQVTGVNVIANDTLSHQYYARGYALGVMYDGIPSYNGMTPSHHFDLALYERIEVLRGPAGLMRGVGEPGGSVNLVKKKPQERFGLSWKTSAGSWDNYRAEADVTGPLSQDGRLRGRLVMAGQAQRYFYEQTDSDKWLGMAALDYDLGADTLLSLSYSQQDQEVVAPWSGLPASSVAGADGYFPLLDVSRSTFNAPGWGGMRYDTRELALALEHRLGNGWVARLAANHRVQNLYYKYAYTSSGLDPLTGRIDYSSFRGDYDYSRDGLDLYASGPFELLGRSHQLTLGANAERYNSEGRSGRGPGYSQTLFDDVRGLAEPFIAYTSGSENETTQHGFYSQARFSLAEPLTLVLGGRTTDFRNERRNIAPSAPTAWTPGAKASGEFTPYGGLLYELNRHITLYGSYTDIFVPQTQSKADGGVLDPRIGRQYEVGGKSAWFDERLAVSLAWFDLQDKNRAYADPDYPTQSFYLNAGRVQSRGWEVEVVGRPLAGLELMAGYTRLTTRYLKDRNNEGLTYSIQTPKHQFKLWSHYAIQGGALDGLSLGLGVLANSAVQSSRGWRDEVANSGHAVLNGRIGYRIDEHYSIGLNANNLLDRRYYASVGTPNIYNFYGEPRNLALTLSASY